MLISGVHFEFFSPNEEKLQAITQKKNHQNQLRSGEIAKKKKQQQEKKTKTKKNKTKNKKRNVVYLPLGHLSVNNVYEWCNRPITMQYF